MKKKNLLALSALVLSLGLTVSSCAGQPGEQGPAGDKGPQGDKGEQGEPGTPGQDGKTYIDIIVSKVEGGTIKQDLWAVEEGKNETVTFTFVPEDESTDLVIDIEVNGVTLPDVVEPNENGELVWKLTVDENFKSVQLRAATFTNADSYGKDQIEAYYESLVEKDNQLAFAYEDEGDEPDHGQWWNTSVQTTVANEQAKVSSALKDLDEDASAKEKLEAIKPVVEAAKTAIDEAYTKAVTETKEKAIEALDDLSKSVKSDNYKDEDSSKILNDAKTAINAATSIEEITVLVNETPVGENDTIGSYNQLYADKKAAFDAVEGALETVLDKEDGLDKDDKNYKDLVDALKLYGVTVESFPTEVAQTWLDKISAATSFEKYTEDSAAGAEMSYKKGDIKDAVEGAYAVTECLESVKNTLVENIRKQYVDEVDNSKVMTDSNARTTAKSTINNAIDNWLNANKTASLISYTSSDVSALSGVDTQDLDSVSAAAKKENITKVGLIAWIELNVATIDNTPFQTERVQNASASAKKNLEAHVKEIKDGDSDYSKAISWTEVPATATSHAGEYKVNTKIGQKDYEVYNPFVNGAKDIKEDNKAYYAKEDALLTQYSVDSTLEGYVNEDGEPLVIEEDGKVDSAKTAVATVLGLKNWEENGLTGLNKTYDDARILYRNTVSTDITTELEGVEGSTSLTAAFDKLFGNGSTLPTTNKDFTMTDVSLSRKSISTASTVLFDEDTGLQAVLDNFISTMNSDDHDYAIVVKADSNPSVSTSTTEVGKEFKKVFNGVVAGTMTTDDVEDFADDLETLYATDVSNRKSFLLNTLEIQTSNLITAAAGDAEGLTNIATINARLAEAKAALEDNTKYSSKLTAYSEDTYTAVTQWYNDALAWIKAYETVATKNVGDLGLVASDEDVSAYLTAKVAQVTNSVIYNTEGIEINAWSTVKGLLDDITTTNKSVTINVEQGDLDISSAFDKLNAKVTSNSEYKTVTLTYEGFETVSDVSEYVEDVLAIKESIREIANDRLANNAIKGNGTIEGVEGVTAAQEITQGTYTFENDPKLTASVDSNGVINLSGDISETTLGTGTSAAAIFPEESEDTPTFTVVVEFDQEGGETLRSTWLKSTTADTSKLEDTGNSLTGWKTADIEGDEGKHIYCCALLDEYKVNHVLRVEVLDKDSKVVRTITIDIAQLFEDSGLNA